MKAHLKKLTSESIVYGFGAALSRGMQMLLVPVFTRVFAPDAYGVVDLLGLVGALSSLLVVMGTDAALARFFYEAADAEARRTMVSTSAVWRAGVCLAAAAALALAAPLLSTFVFGSPDYAKYVRVTALTVPFTAFFLFQNDVLRVTFQPWKFILLNVVNTALVGGFSILFVVVWKTGVIGVLYGKLVGDAITVTLGFVLVRHQLRRRFDRTLLVRMLAYGAPLLPVAAAYGALQYADRWTLSRFAGLEAVGVYAVAAKIGAALTLAVTAFQMAWGPFAFARAREEAAPRLFARVLTLFVAVASGLALLFGLIAPEVLAVVVPPVYRSAAFPGALLCFAAVAYGAFYIAALGANLALRNDLVAWTSLIAAAVAVGLDLALVRPLGSLGVAIGTTGGYALSTVLLYALAQRVHPLPFRGLRALMLFLGGLGSLAAARVLAPGAWEAGAAGGAIPVSTLAVRAVILFVFVAFAAFLARRIPAPVDPRTAAVPAGGGA